MQRRYDGNDDEWRCDRNDDGPPRVDGFGRGHVAGLRLPARYHCWSFIVGGAPRESPSVSPPLTRSQRLSLWLRDHSLRSYSGAARKRAQMAWSVAGSQECGKRGTLTSSPA
jgi:hypothetical protein